MTSIGQTIPSNKSKDSINFEPEVHFSGRNAAIPTDETDHLQKNRNEVAQFGINLEKINSSILIQTMTRGTVLICGTNPS
jgi:hypothetical protein